MSHAPAARRILAATTLTSFLVIAASAPAQPRQPNLASRLRNEGIGVSITRLERTDGFRFGILFESSGNRLLIAPGPRGTWLISSDGSEAFMGRNPESGAIEIIQQNGDARFILCIVRAAVNFLSDLSGCGENNACLFNAVVSLVNALFSCSAGSASTSTTSPAVPTTASSTIPGTTTSTAQGATTTIQGATTTAFQGGTTSVITVPTTIPFM